MSPVHYEEQEGQLWRISTNPRTGIPVRGRAIEYPCADCGKPIRTARNRVTPGGRCRSCNSIRNRQHGPKAALPAGAKRVRYDGYILVKLDPTDSLCQEPHLVFRSNGNARPAWVPEHRLVMRHALGRPFRKGETVHHINGDKADNQLENLQLLRGSHGSSGALCCGDCGSTNLVHLGIGGGGLV